MSIEIKIVGAVFLSYLSLISLGCSRTDVSMLDEALELAGDNRVSLETVLRHYADDTLKYRAARFLIENMPGHYSFADSELVNRYYNKVDSALSLWRNVYNTAQIKDSIDSLCMEFPRFRRVQDVEVVTAEFLIRNIDTAFNQWQTAPWATHLDFDEFCEYLLPYKAEEFQMLDDWRTYLRTYCTDRISVLQFSDLQRNSALRAAAWINEDLSDSLHPYIDTYTSEAVHRLTTRKRMPFGTCDDYCSLATSAMRSVGVPIAIEFTPQWPYQAQGHSWNVVLGNSGKDVAFCGGDGNIESIHNFDQRMAKAYRRTYAINLDASEIIKSGEFAPGMFRWPFFRDVTRNYFKCNDVELKVRGRHNKFGYLCVFNNRDWVPVAYGRFNGDKVTFVDMAYDNVYLPVCYDSYGDMYAIGAPFLFKKSGICKEFVADSINCQAMVLKRKYPVYFYIPHTAIRLVGGEFQASNNVAFKNPSLIYRIEKPSVEGNEVKVNDTIPYRYWRYIQNTSASHCNIAEIAFFNNDSEDKIEGDVIGTLGSWENNGSTREKAFDGDLLTIFDAPIDSGAWVGMDFRKPVQIDRIQFTGRGDGNTIDIGDNYELLYWTKEGWMSMGRQKATTIRLEYDDVPSNALYLLRDLTKGKQERIFEYIGGKQIWH